MVKKLVYILSFLDTFSFGLMIPILGSQLLAVGGDQFMIGILGSLQGLIQFISGPIVGSFSDSVGVKRVYLLSSYGLLLGDLIFSIETLPCYIIGRIINAFFRHALILIPVLLAESKDLDQAGIQSKLRAFGALCFTFAPIIGGVIMGQSNGFLKLTILNVTLSLANVVVVHLLPSRPSVKKPSKQSTTEKESSLKQIFANLQAVDWNIFGSLFALRFFMETAAMIYQQSFGYILLKVFECTHSQMGLVISFFGVCGVATNMKVSMMKKYFKNGYKWGTMGMCFSFGLIYIFPFFWSYLGFVVLFSVFRTLLEVTWTDSIIAMSTKENYGSVSGAFQSLVQLAGFVAPLMYGYVAQMYDYQAAILMCVVVSLISVGFSYRVKAKVD